jgi:phosphatidylethanolamine-binding protein
MLDPEVNLGGLKFTFLHWLHPNIGLAAETATIPAAAGAANAVEYLQPDPMAGDPPHRYTFLLFAQPPNFAMPAKYKDLQLSIVGFDVADFAKEAGLGAPLAATYMLVGQ